MKTIPLTHGMVTIVDDQDYDLLSQWKWSAHWGETKTYYASRVENGKTILMHRQILNAKSNQWVDHKDGNTLDNRRDNIRLCSRSQNMRNRKVPVNNRLGIKGVRVKNGRYEARIMSDKRAIFLGGFETALEATLAYNAASLKYHGEFGRLNIIP
jgi:hypothetical protein